MCKLTGQVPILRESLLKSQWNFFVSQSKKVKKGGGRSHSHSFVLSQRQLHRVHDRPFREVVFAPHTLN